MLGCFLVQFGGSFVTRATLFGGRAGGGEGRCTHENACRMLPTIDLASIHCRDGASRVFAGQAAYQKGNTSL